LNDLGAKVRIARNALQRSTIWRRGDLQLMLLLAYLLASSQPTIVA